MEAEGRGKPRRERPRNTTLPTVARLVSYERNEATGGCADGSGNRERTKPADEVETPPTIKSTPRYRNSTRRPPLESV